MADNKLAILLTASDQTKAAMMSAQKNMSSLSSSADEASAKLKSAFSSIGLTLGGALSVRHIAGLADEFSSLQARLKLASRDVDEFNAANISLTRIASAAQTPLSETATLYTRIASSVKDLKVSQEQVAGVTESVALALRISGASAGESSSAMLQFSQAIASGALRGEEFNAVNESAPRLLQALATSLGQPVGALREMAKEGKLTRDVLIDGLLAQLPALRAEAETLPKTIGAAFTELNNKLLLTIGQLDQATGASKAMQESLSSVGSIGLETLAVLGANVSFVFKGIGRDIGGIAAQMGALLSGDFSGFSKIHEYMIEDAKIARAELDALEKKILGTGETVKKVAGEIKATSTGGITLGIDTKELKKLQDGLAKALDTKPFDDFIKKLRASGQSIEQEWAKFKAALTPAETIETPSILDVGAATSNARIALAGGDKAGFDAALSQGKDLLKKYAEQGGGIEVGYLADQMRDLELEFVSMSEQAAISAQSAMQKAFFAVGKQAEALKIQNVEVDVDLLRDQVKSAQEEVVRQLQASPMVIPVIVKPVYQSDGALSVDIGAASLKYGSR